MKSLENLKKALLRNDVDRIAIKAVDYLALTEGRDALDGVVIPKGEKAFVSLTPKQAEQVVNGYVEGQAKPRVGDRPNPRNGEKTTKGNAS